jgi:hypothetical protein
MSYMTQAVVVTSVLEDQDQLDALNVALNQMGHKQRFEKLSTREAGGTKVFCGQVWAAAFNYIRSEDIRAAVKSVGWAEPSTVFLLLEEEHDTSSAERVSDLQAQEE